MAKETGLSLFLGTDFQYVLHVMNEAETASIDIAGWAISFMVKRSKGDADAAALLTKTTPTAIVIAGAFNATPASNLQRATLTLVDTDTDTKTPNTYHYEFKRTDDGFETPLAYGLIAFRRGVHR